MIAPGDRMEQDMSMGQPIVTIDRHIIDQQRHFPEATG
jgi:hypothetical protein